MRRRILPSLAFSSVLLAASCSPTDTSLVPLGAELDCSHVIDGLSELPDDYREHGGSLALPDREMHGLGRRGPDGDPDSIRQFAKMGLLVRRGAEFQLHVGSESQGNAIISWGNAGTPGAVGSLNVGGCPGESPWLVYAGGVWVLQPACVDLTLVNENEVINIQMPIGAPCQGDPPAE